MCFVLIRYTDDCWDYAAILWNGAQAAAVQAAFEKLTYREQRLWEERNAICMTCGRVSPLLERKTFAELAAMFEGSIASGAERVYSSYAHSKRFQETQPGREGWRAGR